MAPAARCPPGYLVELRDDRLVRFLDRRRPVPGAPVIVLGADQGAGQGAVSPPTLVAKRGAIHGRAHQRMAQLKGTVLAADEPRDLGRIDGIVPRAQGERGSSHDADPTGVVGGRNQEKRAGRLGQSAVPVQERSLDALGQWQLRGQRRPPAQLVARQGVGELDEGKRVPSRSGHQAFEYVRRDRSAGSVAEQPAGGGDVQVTHGEVGQVAAVEAQDIALSCREQQRQRFSLQPPRDEQQRGG